jgi:hypothetical protein
VTPGSESQSAPATAVTVVTGQRFEIAASPETVETAIVGASRGSIMQLAWFTEAASGRSIAINPLHVVALEAVEGPAPAA